MRATNGRHSPSNGLPYTRILAAFMLATLISTIFALPAFAAGHVRRRYLTAPVASANVAGSSVNYITTVTDTSVGPVAGVVFTDTIDVGTITAISSPSVDGLRVHTRLPASCAAHDFG